MHNLNGRLARLEGVVSDVGTRPAPYLAFPTLAAFEAARRRGEVPEHTKVYIGVSPDDWSKPDATN